MAWQEDDSFKVATCHDCGCKEGQFHEHDCDMERCPFCGGQLISCDCCYEILRIDVSKGTWAYKHGLSEAQDALWEKALQVKGRIPYIQYPNLCCYCGARWPEMFNVPDAEWTRYVQKDKRGKMLCRPCYDKIRKLLDANADNRGKGR